MEKIFFDNWHSIERTALITVLAYAVLILMLRLAGKRTLSKMNAFDLIVTVAFGSALATVALSKQVALADGVLAFLLFILLQFGVTWLSVRVKMVKRTVTSTPTLLLYKGKVLEEAMQHQRVTLEEICAKARENGFGALEEIDAMVLETNGKISVIGKLYGKATALSDVMHFEDLHQQSS